jgi:hypothetical protein
LLPSATWSKAQIGRRGRTSQGSCLGLVVLLRNAKSIVRDHSHCRHEAPERAQPSERRAILFYRACTEGHVLTAIRRRETRAIGQEGSSTAPACSSERTAMWVVESAPGRGARSNPRRGRYGRWTAVRLTVYSSPPPRLSLSESFSPGAFFISVATSEAAAPAISLPST